MSRSGTVPSGSCRWPAIYVEEEVQMAKRQALGQGETRRRRRRHLGMMTIITRACSPGWRGGIQRQFLIDRRGPQAKIDAIPVEAMLPRGGGSRSPRLRAAMRARRAVALPCSSIVHGELLSSRTERAYRWRTLALFFESAEHHQRAVCGIAAFVPLSGQIRHGKRTDRLLRP